MDNTENKTGFLEEAPGKQSSTRMNILIVLLNGVAVADAICAAGLYRYIKYDNHETLSLIATAVALIITATVLPVAGWKVMQKDKENN